MIFLLVATTLGGAVEPSKLKRQKGKRNLTQYSGIVNIVANMGNNAFKLSLAGLFFYWLYVLQGSPSLMAIRNAPRL